MKLVKFYAPTRQKILFSLASLSLLFLSTGCTKTFTRKVDNQSCKDAEIKVGKIQEQYNNIVAKLASQSPNEDKIKAADIIQKLNESQEEAFNLCEKFN